ncbi:MULTISPECIES: nucleoside triphosphate pyrophosphohydrolase [Paraliobacillus]|uniref:nucleoside triphosphate pyrophosphohydrolase n=1 Tax=Paraliobacillus TaxID=200903 RepID=UPI000DD38731|nr:MULTISPECIES: nucleoside triphosphate pyrophosphohydrolase [Paraliobacillus]
MVGRIEIVGLGAGDIDQLPLGIYRKLTKQELPLYLRTVDHPVIDALKADDITYTSFDAIYEANDQFEGVYQTIAKKLVEAAKNTGSILYAVPGHPMLAEKTVQLLLQQTEVDVTIIGGQSYLDALFTALKIDPIDGFQFLDATSYQRSQIDYRNQIVFCQVYDSFVASEVKLTLLEDLPPEHPITIVEAVGSGNESLHTIPLVELDQGVTLSNLTSVYVPPVKEDQINQKFFRLRDVIAKLRGPDGCPWDQKQTHHSLRNYLIEEAYELIDAINQEDDDAIAEELGDVLLQVMLHSQIGEDAGYFTIDDVIKGITDKMIRRHPHVFDTVEVNDELEVIANWEAIKRQEKTQRPISILDRVPDAASPLIKAEGLQKEAAKVGFDWTNPEPIWDKVTEELAEVKDALENGTNLQVEKEFGDILFAIVNLARYYKINSEIALEQTNQKFIDRFHYIEAEVNKRESLLESMTLLELDQLWQEAKKLE